MKSTAFRECIRYCVPSVLGMLGLSCYILADTFFIANGIGTDGLAALNLALPVYSLIHGVGLMLGVGGATQFSIRKSRAGTGVDCKAFTHTITLAVLFAVVFVLAGIFLAAPITHLLGADAEVFQMSRTYLQMLLLCSPAFILNEIILGFVRNDGSPHLSMAAMAGGSVSNILLDYIFIFPLQMGIFGAVLATCIAPVISLAILSIHFLRRKNSFYPAREALEGQLMKSIAAGGLPSLVTELSGGFVMTVFNQIVLQLCGNIGVAAYGVVANLSLVVIAMYTGVGQGIQPIVSQSCGVGILKYAKSALRFAVWFTVILSVCIYGSVFIGCDWIVNIFNSERDPELHRIAAAGLKIYFTGGIFAGGNIVLASYFAASERPRPGNIVSMLRGFVLILPFALMLSRIGGMAGLWVSFPVAEGVTLAAGWMLYIHEKGETSP